MKKLLPALIYILGSILLFSCQKEIDFNDPSQNGNNNNNNNNNSASYNPLTKDSWWKYKDSLTGVVTHAAASNRTSTINNIVYTAIVPVGGAQTDTAWMASPRPNYYLFQEGIDPNSGGSFSILFHYLNDTASVGYSWQYNAGAGNGFTAHIQPTII